MNLRSLRRAPGAVVLCLAVQGAAFGQETPLPELTGRVVDQADLLSPEEESQLEAFLARLEAETSVQLVVVSVPRIDGAIEDFSLRLAEAWQIGQSETDNGALVVVSQEDRRVRIEVGYGLEAVIPDGLAGRIIRDELAPRFAAGDFAGGFGATATAIAQAARGNTRAPVPERTRPDDAGPPGAGSRPWFWSAPSCCSSCWATSETPFIRPAPRPPGAASRRCSAS